MLQAVLAVITASPLQAIVMVPYIFALDESVPGLALMGLEARLCQPWRQRWWQVPVALLFVCGKVGAWVVRPAADVAGLVPPSRPIWEWGG